jgi:perosamine synthetase
LSATVNRLREPIPRLPVFGWSALSGGRDGGTPCLLDLPGMHYSTSGRASILLALEALNVGAGDRMLLPTYHCPTMVAPAVDRGAEPFFYPLNIQGTPDLNWLSKSDLRGVKVMLAAHYFGLPQPMQEIAAWCAERSIVLIEDCAHALFGRAGGRPIGAWGDIAIASLTKFLPVPEGGCIVMTRGSALRGLNDSGVGAELRAGLDMLDVGARQGHLPGLNTVINGSLWAMRRLRGGAGASGADGGGSNETAVVSQEPSDFHIDREQAHRQLAGACRWAAGSLPRARIVQRRRAHYARLADALSGRRGLRPLLPSLPEDCAPYVFPLWVNEPDPGYAELRLLRMPVFRWERLWPGTPRIDSDHGTQWAHHVVQLACHQDMSEHDLARFVHELLRLYECPG